MRVRGTSESRSGLCRPVIAIVAAYAVALHMLLAAVLGVAPTARAGDIAAGAIICLAHDASAPAENPDQGTACLDHCVLCTAAQATMPARSAALDAAQRVREVLRWRAVHAHAPRPPATSSASPRGPPLAA